MRDRHPIFEAKLPVGWRLATVDDIKAEEKHSCVAGPFGSSISSKYFVPEGIPVIRGSNLTDDLTRFVAEKFVFVSEERAQKYKGQHVRAGDLVFTCWGTIGQVGLIPSDGPYDEYIISNKQLKLRPAKSKADSLFLFYYFASPQMVAHIRNRAIGSAVPGINLGILKALPVALPPLPTQRKIASILSAYDDLIENNTRRIAILEEMARALYREWFVHFRFPGHENVKMVDSPLGMIPEGWEAVTLGQVTTKIGSGATPRGGKGAYKASGTSLIRSLNVYDYQFEAGNLAYIDEKQASALSNVEVLRGDVLLNITGASVARCCMVPSSVLPARVNQHVSIIRADSKQVSPYYILDTINSERKKQELLARAQGGATREAITKGMLEGFDFLLPRKDIVGHYSHLAAPLHEQRDSLRAKSEKLKQARDLLLPKLISGKIDVSHFDHELPRSPDTPVGQQHEELAQPKPLSPEPERVV